MHIPFELSTKSGSLSTSFLSFSSFLNINLIFFENSATIHHVDDVENLSPPTVDNSQNTARFVDSVENLSPPTVDNIRNAACFVDDVENLSPTIVDNSRNAACFVDDVENLSPAIVDNSRNAACFVDDVENLSPTIVDNLQARKEASIKTELSTKGVDNSVEKCAEVELFNPIYQWGVATGLVFVAIGSL